MSRHSSHSRSLHCPVPRQICPCLCQVLALQIPHQARHLAGHSPCWTAPAASIHAEGCGVCTYELYVYIYIPTCCPIRAVIRCPYMSTELGCILYISALGSLMAAGQIADCPFSLLGSASPSYHLSYNIRPICMSMVLAKAIGLACMARVNPYHLQQLSDSPVKLWSEMTCSSAC